MNNFGFFLASLLASISPSEEKSPSPRGIHEISVETMGSETVQEIRTHYIQGQYATFLKELDTAYQQAKESPSFAQFLDMRQETVSPQENHKWKTLFSTWKEDRDQKLLQACAEENNSVYYKKIVSIATSLTDAEETALETLASYHCLPPGSGASNDENQLIALDIEYEFKRMHLDSYAALESEASFHELRLQHDLLKMEEMDRMLAASLQFENDDLKEMVQQAAHSLDQRLAQVRDSFDVYALLKKENRNDLEERLATILSSYQTKYSDLYKDLLQT